VEKALSKAVNGHSMVAIDDVKTALEKHSLRLVMDFGFEMRDVSEFSEKIFYDFIGEGQRLTPDRMTARLAMNASRSLAAFAPQRYGKLSSPRQSWLLSDASMPHSRMRVP
jgi:hypothetical protein